MLAQPNHPLLRFVAWEVLQTLRYKVVNDLEPHGISGQEYPSCGLCTQSCGSESMKRFDDLAFGHDRAPLKEQGVASSTKRSLATVEKLTFICFEWVNCFKDQVGLS